MRFFNFVAAEAYQNFTGKQVHPNSIVLLDNLRAYLKTYQPGPKAYLLESEQAMYAYPIHTVQQIFSNAKETAGIKKDVGIHSLRHNFPTHLLEKDNDIKYIKNLLGHFDIRKRGFPLNILPCR
ncbi:MAG: tyrosine-type recombinase/integrase [Flavisolibacter sp.]